MLKILFIPTGNIFTLPDAEAMKIYKSDRGNNYKILEGGFLDKKEESITQKETEIIVANLENKAKQIEDEDNKPPEEVVRKINPKEPVVTEETLNPKNLTKRQLVGMLHRINLRGDVNEKKEVLVQRLKDAGIL